MQILRLFSKKRHRRSEEIYRPVSILPVTSKIFEKLLCKQITLCIEQLLSMHQCGRRKGFSVQSLLAMLEKWKRRIDKGNVFGVFLADL